MTTRYRRRRGSRGGRAQWQRHRSHDACGPEGAADGRWYPPQDAGCDMNNMAQAASNERRPAIYNLPHDADEDDITRRRRRYHHTAQAARKERQAGTVAGMSKGTHISAATSSSCMDSTWVSPLMPPTTTMRPLMVAAAQ
mmetsp:Transcript_5430/g.15537  ORF Transcript_5430/g.15537 Transcript_5430/m.15537 type:complete len:140 (-) Transcript_5430:2475-2894(-)